MNRTPLDLESCIKMVGSLNLIEAENMKNTKNNIIAYTLEQLNYDEIEDSF